MRNQPRDLPCGDKHVGCWGGRRHRCVVEHKAISRHGRGSSGSEDMGGEHAPPDGMARLGPVGDMQP